MPYEVSISKAGPPKGAGFVTWQFDSRCYQRKIRAAVVGSL